MSVNIGIVWTFYLKSVPAKFQKYFKHISWVISETSSSKLSCNPRHPSRNISCNHRHHLLQPSWRRIFSTSNNQKTKVDSDINSDYKASFFDKLYIRRRKWDTVVSVRAHQRRYWNALTVDRGHADDGYSCNHRAVLPSDEWERIAHSLHGYGYLSMTSVNPDTGLPRETIGEVRYVKVVVVMSFVRHLHYITVYSEALWHHETIVRVMACRLSLARLHYLDVCLFGNLPEN